MLPLLACSGLTHWAAFSWRVSQTGRSKLASLVSLAVGTGCQLGHLSSHPPLILQQARLASLHGSWILLKPRLQNSHVPLLSHSIHQSKSQSQLRFRRKGARFHFWIREAAKKVWPYLICHIRGGPSLAKKISLWLQGQKRKLKLTQRKRFPNPKGTITLKGI